MKQRLCTQECIRVVRNNWTLTLVAACVLCAASMSRAQVGPSAPQVLLTKAQSLEARGRMDLAAQTWQQVLLADPNNTEALGGLARAAKVSGNERLADIYVRRLKEINPKDAGIARAESAGAEASQLVQLQNAGKLAAAGNYAEAMTLYRKVFGDKPPAGQWALVYYETEAAMEDGRPEAVAGLRSMAEKYPQDARYEVELGRILTYEAKTRAEGQRILERHANDPEALEALRQSLVLDDENPAMAAEIRGYLQRLKAARMQALQLKEQQSRSAHATTASAMVPIDVTAMVEARARLAEEQAGYGALNAEHYAEAEQSFQMLLANYPDDTRALAGMGYVRMGKQDFAGAITFLQQAKAKQKGAPDKRLERALETSRHAYAASPHGSASPAVQGSRDLSIGTQGPSAYQRQAMQRLTPGAKNGIASGTRRVDDAQPRESRSDGYGAYVPYVAYVPLGSNQAPETAKARRETSDSIGMTGQSNPPSDEVVEGALANAGNGQSHSSPGQVAQPSSSQYVSGTEATTPKTANVYHQHSR